MKIDAVSVRLVVIFIAAVGLPALPSSGADNQPVTANSTNPQKNFAATAADIPIALTNTPAAPREAKGAALLQPGVLSLSTQGLRPGRYDLTAVRKPDGGSTPLGVIAITDPSTSPDREANDSENQANCSEEAPILATQTRLTLPAGLQAADIEQLRVSLGGNDMLLGSPPPSSSRAASATSR